jgi:hypothetical protein
MTPECCVHRAVMRHTPVRVPWATLASGLLLVIAPKCPLCIAAYLAVAGIGASAAATLARAVHPVLWLVAALGLAMFIARLVSTRRAARSPTRYGRVG